MDPTETHHFDQEVNIEDIDPDQMQMIADLLPDSILLVNQRGQICFANRASCDLFEYPLDELISKPIEVLVPDTKKSTHVEKRNNYFKAPYMRPMNNMRCFGITKNKRMLDLGVMLQPMQDGDQISVLCVARDMGVPLQNEDELIEKRHFLQEKTSELRLLYSRLPLNLKGPAASIYGLIRLAKEERKKNKKTDEYLDQIERSARNIESVICKLEQVHKNMEPNTNPGSVIIKPMLDAIIRDSQRDPCHCKAAFVCDCPAGLKVVSQPGLLKSIVQNLVENAIVHNHDIRDLQILIKAGIKSGLLTITVADNGHGIPSAIQNKMFDMFERNGGDTQGSGLGLYIVKNAVKSLHGHIGCESAVRKGSTFTVTLPVN